MSKMNESQKRVREYLAEIGRRGGENSRRELFPSHAKKMVAIREMKRAAIKTGKPWPPRNRKTLKLLKLT
jgi:general stress protein YciG